MQSLFGGGELELLGGGGGGDAGGGLKDDCGSVAWRSSSVSNDDVYSASHFALISAYQDIKTRLACLINQHLLHKSFRALSCVQDVSIVYVLI